MTYPCILPRQAFEAPDEGPEVSVCGCCGGYGSHERYQGSIPWMRDEDGTVICEPCGGHGHVKRLSFHRYEGVA